MGTAALRQLLKSFCYNFPWNYAVLWKLRHESRMILSWEDGYCDHPKPRGPVGIMPEDSNCNGANELFSSHSETGADDVGSEGYPIGLVVANMSHFQYALGEGVIGQVANTGNHFWVSYDNVSTDKVNSKLFPECPGEWLHQLASGIKTILLVPVLPQGVVQLGSLEVVAEDLAVVAHIKDRFVHNTGRNTVLSIFNRDISSSTVTPGLTDSLDEPSTSTISPLKSEDSDNVDSIKKVGNFFLSTLDPVVPLVTLQDSLRRSAKYLSGAFGGEGENKIGIPSVSFREVTKSQNHSIYAGQLETMDSKMDSKLLGLSCLKEELQAYSQGNKYNVELLGEFCSEAMTSYPASMEQQFQDDISNDKSQRSSASFLNFPKDCELHKALGSASQRHCKYFWDSSLSVDNIYNSSSLFCSRVLTDGIEPTSSSKCSDAEYLLEAVVASVCNGTDDTCDIFNGVRSSLTSSEKFGNLSPPQSQSEESALAGMIQFHGVMSHLHLLLWTEMNLHHLLLSIAQWEHSLAQSSWKKGTTACSLRRE